MRYATIRLGGATRAARVEDDHVVELPATSVDDLLRRGPAMLDRAATESGVEHSLDSVGFAPLVIAPEKIVCLGLNYEPHIRETGRDFPEYPTLFAKYREVLVGARDPIVLPRSSVCVDWEAELAFVIGRAVRHAGEEEAAGAIAGFTVANDVSVRDWQRRTLQWLQGKTFESTTPLGPWLATPDEVGGARPDLALRCEVDGVLRQEARTSELVFDPVHVVRYLSSILTLRPGDVVLTGTPGGVGEAMDPPTFLEPDQLVETTIEGLGHLSNRCRLEDPPPVAPA